MTSITIWASSARIGHTGISLDGMSALTLLTWPAVTGVAIARALEMSRTSTIGSSTPMSSILFDYLLPLLGPEQAAYWAQVFVINPV